MTAPTEAPIIPTVDEVVKDLDDRCASVVSSNGSRLHGTYGVCALVPIYIEAMAKIRNATGRIHIMFWLIPLARRDPRVVEGAVQHLSDRSAAVRMHACEVLAYSLRDDVIPHLKPLLHHPVAGTREDAAAALDAIKHKNHHYYLDRKHSGSAFWVVNPEDDPDYKPRRWQTQAV